MNGGRDDIEEKKNEKRRELRKIGGVMKVWMELV